jgi:uncharacterized repeat protein (TIGR03847 family)
MQPTYDIELDPVSFITVGAEGPPGGRTFYLQAAQSRRVVTLVIEKEHAIALAASIARLLDGLGGFDEDPDAEGLAARLALLQPVQPDFRVGQLGIGVDEERRVMVLVANELAEPDEPGQRARFVATYEQMQSLAQQAMAVAEQGRPICPLCGEPMDDDGHFCPRSNGHARLHLEDE